MRSFLSIDVGTSSTKLTLFDQKGKVIVGRSINYQVDYPKTDWAEQDPQIWWDAVCKLGHELQSIVSSMNLCAVSVSGQTPLCVPIDQQGQPIRKAILWLDRRSNEQVHWLRENIGEERCRSISVNRLDSYFGGVKWLWFKQNETELFKRTWKILQANSYVIYKLTGSAVIDPSQAGLCSPCFNFHTQSWDYEICNDMGIPSNILPDIHKSIDVVGRITTKAAEQSFLPAGVPVVCGGGDFACSCLGSGVKESGQAALMLGTAGNLLYPGVINDDPLLLHTIHLTGAPLPFGGVLAGGNLNWFANLFGESGAAFFTQLETEAINIPACCEGLLFLPYLMGERSPIWDPEARGAFVGLSTRHTRAHLFRAVLEGIAFAFRQIDYLTHSRSTSGTRQIIAIDGGSQSHLWRSILASVFGVPVVQGGLRSGTSLGNAFLGALGTGYVDSFQDITQWAELLSETCPDINLSDQYNKAFEAYQGLYKSLKPTFELLKQSSNASLSIN